jgi:hypothetical protein
MRGGERAVAWWMPILGQRNVIEALGETIDDRHHGVAVGDRKCSAGTKIVLHIDYQQQIIVAWPDQHSGPVSVLITEL